MVPSQCDDARYSLKTPLNYNWIDKIQESQGNWALSAATCSACPNCLNSLGSRDGVHFHALFLSLFWKKLSPFLSLELLIFFMPQVLLLSCDCTSLPEALRREGLLRLLYGMILLYSGTPQIRLEDRFFLNPVHCWELHGILVCSCQNPLNFRWKVVKP